MNVLLEEDGDLKVGAVMSETDATAQIELASGKRIKAKQVQLLLRFNAPSPAQLWESASKSAAELDPMFLWECGPEGEFGFVDLAKEYFGADCKASEQAATLMCLHAQPMYFRKRGKGIYKRAAKAELDAALASVERKKREGELVAVWVAELIAGRAPGEIKAKVDGLLYAPDKQSLEWKALQAAVESTKQSPEQLLLKSGALRSPYDFHFRRFLVTGFPGYAQHGLGFPSLTSRFSPSELPVAAVEAFSIDDASTTEIDDAFSVVFTPEGLTQVGIHIAAPALGITIDDPVDELARRRLSTVYMPGNKLTMLPPGLIEGYTLAEGRTVPALSLYAWLDAQSAVVRAETRLECVPIAANLRHHEVDGYPLDDEASAVNYPRRDELRALYRFALALKAARGKNDINRVDYNFELRPEASAPDFDPQTAQVIISTRPRGSPLDTLVAELMIFANAQWGEMLAKAGLLGMFRVQGAGKTRMSAHPGPHEGLGVAQYLWSTSPLRRYSDLVNQRQLVTLVQGAPPAYRKGDARLLGAIADFDATYNAYGDFQQQMENYWCLRWMQQNAVETLTATVIRENLVRFDTLPLVRRIESMDHQTPGASVTLRISDIDLMAASFGVTVAAVSPPAS